MSVQRVTRGGRARWIVRWREQGSQRSRVFDRRVDAQAFDRELRRRQQLGPLAVQQLSSRRGPTLGQWISERWAPEHAANLAPSTRERYANVYAVHIAPWLDDIPIGELTVAFLRGWQADRIKAGVTPGTIQKCRTVLSSILRHAAESEAIPANPLSLVRPPRSVQRDAPRPLPPLEVERIRSVMRDPPPRVVIASQRRRAYELPAPGERLSWQRDTLIVSLLAYSGLRPGELRALRWGDVHEATILVQRAANPDGTSKSTKNRHRRSIRLLAPLAQDLREYRLAIGRPPPDQLILRDHRNGSWDKSAWQMWRADRWVPACGAAGLSPIPRPYDLRHSFASLLLAEGRQPLYVARQLGHSLAVLLETYAHLIDEYAERERIDAEAEIADARRQQPVCHQSALSGRNSGPRGASVKEKPCLSRAFIVIPLPGFELR
jgi:integrase